MEHLGYISRHATQKEKKSYIDYTTDSNLEEPDSSELVRSLPKMLTRAV